MPNYPLPLYNESLPTHSNEEEALQWLESFIAEHVQEWSFDGTTKEVPPQDKWIAISSLQKSIRRGDSDIATAIALGMMEMDETYLWRRLKIVAFEDFGAVSPLLVAITTHLSRSKTFRKVVGNRRVTEWLVSTMAEMPKDRTACDLSNIAQYTAEWKKALQISEDLSDHEFEQEMLEILVWPPQDDVDYLITPFIELRIAAGDAPSKHATPADKFPKTRPPKKRYYTHLLDHVGMTPLDWYVFSKSLNGSEGMASALPILRYYYEDEPVFTDEDTSVFTMIGGYPSYGYDGHTVEGKKSFAYWRKSRWQHNPLFMKAEEQAQMSLMKSIVFHAEGTVMSSRLTTDIAKDVLAFQRKKNAEHYGLTYEEFMQLVAEARDHLGELNGIRKKITGS